MEIVDWLKNQKLDYSFIDDKVFVLDEIVYLIIGQEEKILSEEFTLICSEEELSILDAFPAIQRVAFQFGYKWYWSDIEGETKLNPLRHLGKEKKRSFLSDDFTIPFLGIHGKFEILNGSRDYEDWCKKAKFLGYKTLGICETQTLAGTMLFQEACEKYGIKSIIGQTAIVKSKDQTFTLKLFVKNKLGWKNLLKINKGQLVDNPEDRFIDEDELIKYGEGLIAVFTPEIELKPWLIKKYLSNFDDCFYQLDFPEWKSKRREEEWFKFIQDYLSSFRSIIKPIILPDVYYLDKIDAPIKRVLNDIGGNGNQHQSDDQYMKSLDDIFIEFDLFFPEKEFFLEVYENTNYLNELCDFKINTKNRYLPKYKMTHDEWVQFVDNNDLFHFKVLEGFERKVYPKIQDDPEKIEEYLLRIEEEINVLKKGEVIDYFLILSDINRFCDESGILRGHGRGSAGGSLISYLLNITEVDPIQYNLLFERFLNEGRVKTSLPDIDMDYSDRDRVVQYMKDKYGLEYVASVGTYGTIKIKNAIKDLSRLIGITAETANYISACIDKKHDGVDFTGFFNYAISSDKLLNFIRKNPLVFEHLDLILFSVRNSSIHACATIIVPEIDEDGNPANIHDFIPCKMMNGQLVTEWEGGQLEKTGFLKEDILGLKQLEKFEKILKTIKENYSEEIDLFTDVDLEEERVFEYFHKGNNEDVFQFGTEGLKGYCRFLKPSSIEELTAANALYRPGPMESNAHTDFVKIKFDEIDASYDFLLEDVTKNSYSLYIFQEQIMKAYSVVTGASLAEADNFRKVITKSKNSKTALDFDKYENHFIESYVEKGQKREEAKKIWDKLIAFAKYGFNRSHALAYSVIGYVSQWLKVYYPLEFWTISLNESKTEEIPKRISEIKSISNILLRGVNINKSGKDFKSLVSDNSIYWSLNSIKFLGESSVDLIIEEREKNGPFFSLEEFLSRVPKNKINKRCVTNLILSGAFDEMYRVKKSTERLRIIEDYFFSIKESVAIKEYKSNEKNIVFWELKQNALSGFGEITYKVICDKEKFKNYHQNINTLENLSYCTIAGVVEEIRLKNTPKAGDFCYITINSNNELIDVIIWNDLFKENSVEITNCENKIFILSGQIKYDPWKDRNIIHSSRSSKLLII